MYLTLIRQISLSAWGTERARERERENKPKRKRMIYYLFIIIDLTSIPKILIYNQEYFKI
jgi:hypothetical protein